MSKKKNNTKKQAKNTSKQLVGLIGDNHAKKKYILTGLAVSCLAFILFLIFILPAGNDEVPDDNKQTIESDVTISLVGEPVKVEDKMWNLWFTLSTVIPDSVITFEASEGDVMIYDNATETIVDDDEITSDELSKYTFVWTWDIFYDVTLSDLTVSVENKTTLKSTGLYIAHDEESLAMFDRDDYLEMKESEQ